MLILHGMNLKCGKKCRSEFIGTMDSSAFFVFVRSSDETGGTE
jgi:hypothetical protein